MSTPAWNARANYSLLARSDWVLLILVTFPVPFVRLLRSDFSPASVAMFVGELVLLSLIAVVLAILTDRFRGMYSPQSVALDQGTFERLQQSLNEQHLHPRALRLNRLRVVHGDHALGAHVRGVLRPYVVISGAMLVGLLRKHPDANAVLCHEISHLKHFDRILAGLLGLIAFQVIGSVLKIVSDNELGGGLIDLTLFALFVTAYQIVVFGVLASCVSKYREYYADANALCISAVPERYMALLESAARSDSGRFSFFHPTMAQRVAQARKGFPVLRRAWFWKIYLVLAGTVSLFQYMKLESGFIVEYAMSNFLVCAACLLFELLRTPLLRAFPNWSAGKHERIETWPAGTAMLRRNIGPLIFLLCGFAVVIVIADALGESSVIALALGAGIVYQIYSAMKSDGK